MDSLFPYLSGLLAPCFVTFSCIVIHYIKLPLWTNTVDLKPKSRLAQRLMISLCVFTHTKHTHTHTHTQTHRERVSHLSCTCALQ